MTQLDGLTCSYDLLPAEGIAFGVGYYLTLTGAENATTDVVLPAGSAQLGLYSGSPSYFTAVIPYSPTRLSDLLLREDGQLILTRRLIFSDGSFALSEVARFNFEEFSYSLGSRNQSLTVSGTKQTTNGAPGTIALTSADVVDIALQGNGAYRLTLAPNRVFPRAADTLTYDGDSYVVSRVDYSLSPSDHKLAVTATKQ